MPRAQDLIARKRDGLSLEEHEIAWFVRGLATGEVADYQAAAFLMAAYLNGLSSRETAALTRAMAESGQRISFAGDPRPTVDKHSTGGVGDKTSLVVGPVAAAAGALVPMIAGRGLGHTGGTLDKLEAIPGLRTALSPEEFRKQVETVGIAIGGQTERIAPADRTLYALRDVTATVGSIPLITASILSKKIAEGTGALVLDVKVGSGALMPDLTRARDLARSLIDVGRAAGLRVRAVLTDMSQPLGRFAGNAGEVLEALAVLEGRGEERLAGLCRILAGHMLDLAGLSPGPEAGARAATDLIADGRARAKFHEMVAAQGGDLSALEGRETPTARHCETITAARGGHVRRVDARAIGEAAMVLGAGRARAEDTVDPQVSVETLVRVGDTVAAGAPLFRVYVNEPARLAAVRASLAAAVEIGDGPTPVPPLVLDVLG